MKSTTRPWRDALPGPGIFTPTVAGWRYPPTALVAATWGYALAALATLVLTYVVGERVWPVTLLLFCPRWVYLTPAAPLALAAVVARRPSLLPTHAATALVVAGPLMGFTANVVRPAIPRASATRVRVLTLNQHNGRSRAADLIRVIERYRVDVICLQETVFDPALEAYLARGWYRDRGRCIASRLPIIRELDPSTPPYDDPLLDRVLVRSAAGEEIVVASVHRPSMGGGFRALMSGDVQGLRRSIAARREAMSELLSRLAEVKRYPTVVAGDFNTPADSSLLDPLRENFQLGFDQAGCGYGYTWPARWSGIRIDHVMASRDWVFTGCWVGPDLGSDHLPVIAEIALNPSS